MKKIIILILLSTYLSFEVAGAAVGDIGGPFKCGELECPNGCVCEIKQTPNADNKFVRITTQCRTVGGAILQEVSRTEEVPAGQIAITSTKIISVSGGIYGPFTAIGGRTNGHGANPDATYGIEGAENADEAEIDFVPLDSENDMDSDIDAGLDKTWNWNIFEKPRHIWFETTNFINGLFRNLFSLFC